METKRTLFFLVCLIICKGGHCIIGYDCTQGVSNLTTFSLLQVAECDIEEPKINTTRVPIKLLQVHEFTNVHVKLCKIRITRLITTCGFWSHSSIVNRPLASYLLEVTREQCEKMHVHRSLSYRDEIINHLLPNNTKEHPMTFVEKIDNGGSCKSPGYWNDPYGSYEDVLVTGHLEISLMDYQATVNLLTNEVILKSGTRCKMTEIECIDMEAGYAYWNALPVASCEENKYISLYEGLVNKIEEEGEELHPTYVIESKEITFAFKSLGMVSECAHRLSRTEDPKIFILEGSELDAFHSVERSSLENLDIFVYFNSKHVFVEKHIKGQIKRLYYDLLMQKCELERKVIANALSIAVSAPDMFAYIITKKFGYFSILGGEVIYMLKCVQVDVARRNVSKCYQELPVERDGKDFFLTPRTHILKEYGTETVCNPLIPPMYLLGNSWYVVLPQYTTHVKEPLMLKPTTKRTWNYTDPLDLARSGIYSYNEVQALKHLIMFSVDKPAVLNNVALGMAGKAPLGADLSIAGLLDEKTMTKLADNAISRMWGKFMAFGSASAGIIGIFIVIKLIKFVADTIINGYSIFSIFGFSLALFAAIWNSLTQLLLHIGRDLEKSSEKMTEEREKTEPQNAIAPQEQVEYGAPYPPEVLQYYKLADGSIATGAAPPIGITTNHVYPDLNREIFPPPKRKRQDGDEV